MTNPDASTEQLVYQPEVTFELALKAWRHRTGFTQVQTAALLRVPLTTYQGWEHGRPCPTAFAVITALHALASDSA